MRWYAKWRADPVGKPEDVRRCVVSVMANPPLLSVQCSRLRGQGSGELKGLLCTQHAEMQKAGKPLSVPEDVKAS